MRNKFIIIFIILIAGMLLTEAILWIVFPLPRGNSLKVEVRNNNLPGLKTKILFTRNAFGFRSMSMRTAKKPPHTIRIICLGASTTQQSVQATEDLWSAILEKELNKEFFRDNIKIEVAALGTSPGPAIDRLLYVRNKILKFEPDLVIVLEGINNLCFQGGPGYTYTKLEDKIADWRNRDKKVSRYFSWRTFLWRYSQIYRRLLILKHKFELYMAVKKGVAWEWHSRKLPQMRKQYRDLPYVEEPRRQIDPIIEFSDIMVTFLRFFKDAGVRVIVLGQPVLWKADMNSEEISALWFYVKTSDGSVRPSSAWLEKEMSRYNDAQREIAVSFKVPFVDLDKKIPKNLQYFFDDCHFTDLGSVKVAQEIYPAVREQVKEIIGSRGEALPN